VKSICALFLSCFCWSPSPPASMRQLRLPHGRMSIMFFFAKAALGKGAEAGEMLKKGIGSSMAWDTTLSCATRSGETGIIAVIEHLGAKATDGGPRYCSTCWFSRTGRLQNDNLVSGPAWPEFSKAMAWTMQLACRISLCGLVFRPAPGHDDELEKSLATTALRGSERCRRSIDAVTWRVGPGFSSPSPDTSPGKTSQPARKLA